MTISPYDTPSVRKNQVNNVKGIKLEEALNGDENMKIEWWSEQNLSKKRFLYWRGHTQKTSPLGSYCGQIKKHTLMCVCRVCIGCCCGDGYTCDVVPLLVVVIFSTIAMTTFTRKINKTRLTNIKNASTSLDISQLIQLG